MFDWLVRFIPVPKLSHHRNLLRVLLDCNLFVYLVSLSLSLSVCPSVCPSVSLCPSVSVSVWQNVCKVSTATAAIKRVPVPMEVHVTPSTDAAHAAQVSIVTCVNKVRLLKTHFPHPLSLLFSGFRFPLSLPCAFFSVLLYYLLYFTSSTFILFTWIHLSLLFLSLYPYLTLLYPRWSLLCFYSCSAVLFAKGSSSSSKANRQCGFSHDLIMPTGFLLLCFSLLLCHCLVLPLTVSLSVSSSSLCLHVSPRVSPGFPRCFLFWGVSLWGSVPLRPADRKL